MSYTTPDRVLEKKNFLLSVITTFMQQTSNKIERRNFFFFNFFFYLFPRYRYFSFVRSSDYFIITSSSRPYFFFPLDLERNSINSTREICICICIAKVIIDIRFNNKRARDGANSTNFECITLDHIVLRNEIIDMILDRIAPSSLSFFSVFFFFWIRS